jgi:hypothetical protein
MTAMMASVYRLAVCVAECEARGEEVRRETV